MLQKNSTIAIAWTPDFGEQGEKHLISAIDECSKTFPGYVLHICGSRGIFDPACGAEHFLAKTLRIHQEKGWVADASKTLSHIFARSRLIHQQNFDAFVIITRQPMETCYIGRYFEYSNHEMAIASLNFQVKDEDLESVATVFLKNAIARILLDTMPNYHCNRTHCVLMLLSDPETILMLAKSDTSGLNCFCDKCQKKIRRLIF